MKNKNPYNEYLKTRGNSAKLARGLGVDRSAITLWKGVVPLERVHDVAGFIGCTPEEIRPDFFGREVSA